MKANKFFAIALAALALVACEKKEVEDLKLDQNSLSLKVGEEATVTASVAVEFNVDKADVAALTPANDGKSVLVKALKEGNAIITAKSASGQTKTCVVAVVNGSIGGDGAVKGSQIWPVVLDEASAESVKSKIVGDFRVDDATNFLYIWASGETYNAGEGTGLNSLGKEGYVALTVAAPEGWSGLGFCLTEAGTAWQAAEALRKAIVENPQDYYFHFAIKSATQGNHQLYVFNDAQFSFNVGTAIIEKGSLLGDFPRTGAWTEFDVPMSQFAQGLAGTTFPAGGNILCVLSGNTVGSQLNLDACYFYKK